MSIPRMSRQLRRGAVITATLAGAAFAATAPALADSPAGQFQIMVRGQLSGAIQQWTLTCGPDGGSHTDAEAACDRLRETDGDLESMRTISGPCPRIYDPEHVTILGTWNGRPVYFDQAYPNASCLLATAKPIVPEAAGTQAMSAEAPTRQPAPRPAADRVQIIDHQAAEPAADEDQQADPTVAETDTRPGNQAYDQAEYPADDATEAPGYGGSETLTYIEAEGRAYDPAEDAAGDEATDEAGEPVNPRYDEAGDQADDQARVQEDRRTGGREFAAEPDQDDEYGRG